jgi:hypothetical protein
MISADILAGTAVIALLEACTMIKFIGGDSIFLLISCLS